jgi:hypothetical protein
MTRERLYLFDTTLRARSRAGAVQRGLASRPGRRARTNEKCRRAGREDAINV